MSRARCGSTTGRLEIAARGPRAYDGVDLKLVAPLDARLQISLWPDDSQPPEKPVEVPLADLVSDYHNSVLDDRDNRLLVRRAPGDQLRVRLEAQRTSLVFAPGETMRLEMLPRLLGTGGGEGPVRDAARGDERGRAELDRGARAGRRRCGPAERAAGDQAAGGGRRVRPAA